jgi:hypothetical protein
MFGKMFVEVVDGTGMTEKHISMVVHGQKGGRLHLQENLNMP